MLKSTKIKGDEAETLVSQWFGAQGYTIVQRNFRCRNGEVDIIVSHENTLIFVEVKSRVSGGIESLFYSINSQKRKRIIHCAEVFLASEPQWENSRIRFDVVFVGTQEGICHFPDAFTESGFT
jgi:putative endonuclease